MAENASQPEESMPIDQSLPAAANWGAELVARINQLDLTDWEQMDIPDVGEWVHQLRRKESERHSQDWNGTAEV